VRLSLVRLDGLLQGPLSRKRRSNGGTANGTASRSASMAAMPRWPHDVANRIPQSATLRLLGLPGCRAGCRCRLAVCTRWQAERHRDGQVRRPPAFHRVPLCGYRRGSRAACRCRLAICTRWNATRQRGGRRFSPAPAATSKSARGARRPTGPAMFRGLRRARPGSTGAGCRSAARGRP